MLAFRALTLSTCLGLLSACSSWHPSPVKDPTQKDLIEISTSALVPPTTVVAAAVRVHQLSLYYQNQSDDLKKSDNWAKEGVFGGSLIAAGAGLAESATAAAAGIAIAGGSSIVSDHYVFAIQSANYKSASRALSCMFIPLWNSASLGYPVNIAKVNSQIEHVVHRLKDAQDDIALATPDVAALQSSLSSKSETELAVNESGANEKTASALTQMAMDTRKSNMSALNADPVGASITVATVILTGADKLALANDLYAELEVCADSF